MVSLDLLRADKNLALSHRSRDLVLRPLTQAIMLSKVRTVLSLAKDKLNLELK